MSTKAKKHLAEEGKEERRKRTKRGRKERKFRGSLDAQSLPDPI